MSLLEVIIAIGIMGIVITGTISMTINSMKAQKSIQLTDELQNTLFITKVALSNPANCSYLASNHLSRRQFDRNEIATTGVSAITVNEISTSTSGNAIARNGSHLPGSENSRVDLKIEDITEIKMNDTYMGNLKFYFTKSTSGQVIGANQIVRSIPIILKTTAVGTIQTVQTCYTFNSEISSQDLITIKEQVCQSMGGTWNAGSSLCELSNTLPTNTAQCETSFGAGWTWNGSTCTPPAQLSTVKIAGVDPCDANSSGQRGIVISGGTPSCTQDQSGMCADRESSGINTPSYSQPNLSWATCTFLPAGQYRGSFGRMQSYPDRYVWQ